MRATKCRSAAGAAVRRFVEALDQITRLLEFDRQKVSRRDIDPLQFNAGCVTAAGNNFVGPELQARSIRFAVEKVHIVLSDEPACFIYRIACGRGGRCLGSGLRIFLITYLVERDGVETVGRVRAPVENSASGCRAELPRGERTAVFGDENAVTADARAYISTRPVNLEAVLGLCGGE